MGIRTSGIERGERGAVVSTRPALEAGTAVGEVVDQLDRSPVEVRARKASVTCLGAAPTGRCRERDFTLEERANAWILREGRRPELDNHEALGQVDPVDRGPHRWGFAVLLVEAITIRRRDESKIAVGCCGRRQRYRSLLLVEAASRLLAVPTALWTRVVIDPSQGIDVSGLKRVRAATWLAVFGDHDTPAVGVDGIDCVERQQAPMPKNDPVSTDREPLFARLRIIDQLDDQPDPSAAGVEYRVAGRRAK
jgi:hypothetical protein